MVNNDEIRVSVAMAVYNSENFIIPQINSIIKQLSQSDELVISYNESTDNTWKIISNYAKQDYRVKIYKCKKKGLLANFDSAISHTKGKYIFLSDHDDVWLDNKVENVLRTFEKENSILVLHGRYVTDCDLNVKSKVDYRDFKSDFIHNLISNRYCGSCMAFKSEMKKIICPIPLKNLYHDAWIGMLSSFFGQISVINEPLIFYRRHNSNLSFSNRRKIQNIASERISTFIEITKRLIKTRLCKRKKRLNKLKKC